MCKDCTSNETAQELQHKPKSCDTVIERLAKEETNCRLYSRDYDEIKKDTIATIKKYGLTHNSAEEIITSILKFHRVECAYKSTLRPD